MITTVLVSCVLCVRLPPACCACFAFVVTGGHPIIGIPYSVGVVLLFRCSIVPGIVLKWSAAPVVWHIICVPVFIILLLLSSILLRINHRRAWAQDVAICTSYFVSLVGVAGNDTPFSPLGLEMGQWDKRDQVKGFHMARTCRSVFIAFLKSLCRFWHIFLIY